MTVTTAALAAVVLASLPVVYQRPATTILTPYELALNVLALSEMESTPPAPGADSRFPTPPPPGVRGRRYSLYPYTVDVYDGPAQAGTLAVLTSRAGLPPASGTVRYRGVQVRMAPAGDALMLLPGDSEGTWAADAFDAAVAGVATPR